MGINDNLDFTDIVTSLADIIRYIPYKFASKQLIITLFWWVLATIYMGEGGNQWQYGAEPTSGSLVAYRLATHSALK